jgi:hypothetical protein
MPGVGGPLLLLVTGPRHPRRRPGAAREPSRPVHPGEPGGWVRQREVGVLVAHAVGAREPPSGVACAGRSSRLLAAGDRLTPPPRRIRRAAGHRGERPDPGANPALHGDTCRAGLCSWPGPGPGPGEPVAAEGEVDRDRGGQVHRPATRREAEEARSPNGGRNSDPGEELAEAAGEQADADRPGLVSDRGRAAAHCPQ